MRLRDVYALWLLALAGCSSAGQGVNLSDAGDHGRQSDLSDAWESDGAEVLDLLDVSDGLDGGDAGEAGEIDAGGCKPGQGCWLDKCKDNEECLSGWCVDQMGEGVCTVTCQDECPPGWSCQQIAGTWPDVVYVCVSDYTNLCRPCATGNDCKSEAGPEDVCLEYGGEGSFCGGACGIGGKCPEGFVCQNALTVDGIPVKQCVAESGTCPCTGKSVALALWTPCERTSEAGTCEGKRICTEQGLTECDAALPVPEECNGLDDDCDGEPDKDTCDDGNGCTADACLGADGCQSTPLSQGECLDGNACTVGDHCVEGECQGSPVLCDDKDPCTDDACDGLGGCSFEHNHAACDDGDPCTVADECKDGQCAGFPVFCECQQDEDCAPAPAQGENVCAGKVVCDQSVVPHQCVVEPGSVVVCPEPEGPAAVCLKAVCDPVTGTCSNVPDHDGFACDDQNACTLGDACLDGKCPGQAPANCADDNPCTDDFCLPEEGCQHAFNQAGCADGDACTIGDFCQQGKCVPGTPAECGDGNACTQDACDVQKGCVHTALAGIECDDGNPCTDGDACQAGACKGLIAVMCDDGNICTNDWCDPTNGCSHAMNSVACDDGDLCTVADKCQGGTCKPGPTFPCNDANGCTHDWCDPLLGCIHDATNEACEDGSVCTTSDHCDKGKCVPGPALNCDEGNACTADSCDPAAGCLHVPLVPCCGNGSQEAGEQCDDGGTVAGDGCAATCQCEAGSCVPGCKVAGTKCEKQQGVCAGSAKPEALCVAGFWHTCTDATYSGWSAAYQAGEENLCDGLDNDCDGLTDESCGGQCTTKSWGGHTYLFCKELVDWQTAVSKCSQKGYYLVTINDQSENTFVGQTAQGLDDGHDWWLGANDIGHEGQWTWVGAASSFFFWGGNDPDGGGSQNCAQILYWGGSNYGWIDDGCEDNDKNYVCEK